MQDRPALVTLLAILTLFVVACQPSAPAPTAKGPARVVVGVTETMDSPNPYADSTGLLYSTWCAVYGCLVRYDPDKGDYAPWLAESWTVDNPTTWTFKLRRTIKFNDGTPMTAADVVHSVNLIVNDPSSKQQSSVMPRGSRIEAVDEHTVRVTTPGVTSCQS